MCLCISRLPACTAPHLGRLPTPPTSWSASVATFVLSQWAAFLSTGWAELVAVRGQVFFASHACSRVRKWHGKGVAGIVSHASLHMHICPSSALCSNLTWWWGSSRVDHQPKYSQPPRPATNQAGTLVCIYVGDHAFCSNRRWKVSFEQHLHVQLCRFLNKWVSLCQQPETKATLFLSDRPRATKIVLYGFIYFLIVYYFFSFFFFLFFFTFPCFFRRTFLYINTYGPSTRTPRGQRRQQHHEHLYTLVSVSQYPAVA